MLQRLLPLFLVLSMATEWLSISLSIYNMRYVRTHTLFDIDLIRQEYIDDITYFARWGCEAGTDYGYERPDRVKQPGFDEDSPSVYCAKWTKDRAEALQERAVELGRDWRRKCSQ